ncbi:MAG: hypothetical protein JW828_12555 [Sedimentisphaerales bacterium]|nr:hypothetical protein [Sedimentisphaerales bacterium]
MKASHAKILSLSFVCLVVLAGSLCYAQPRQRGGVYGDWEVKQTFNDREFVSIISFGRDREGNMTGQWISLFGVSDLQEIKREENQVSFMQVMRFGDQERKSNFKGAFDLEKGVLTGTLTGENGERTIEGKRMPRIPSTVGIWNLTLTMGEREIPSVLVISADKEGQLQGKWESQRGESTISDVQFENRTLTFKRISTYNDQQRESTFEGTFSREGGLEGMLKSERGEIAVKGVREGADLIGQWDLVMTSERGESKQRLVVYPDLSGRYGAMPVKLRLEEGQLRFDNKMQFGDREFEMNFAGKLQEEKLVGELKTTMGTSKFIGTKRQFMGRQRPQQQ